jgi:hypothetical protein
MSFRLCVLIWYILFQTFNAFVMCLSAPQRHKPAIASSSLSCSQTFSFSNAVFYDKPLLALCGMDLCKLLLWQCDLLWSLVENKDFHCFIYFFCFLSGCVTRPCTDLSRSTCSNNKKNTFIINGACKARVPTFKYSTYFLLLLFGMLLLLHRLI